MQHEFEHCMAKEQRTNEKLFLMTQKVLQDTKTLFLSIRHCCSIDVQEGQFKQRKVSGYSNVSYISLFIKSLNKGPLFEYQLWISQHNVKWEQPDKTKEYVLNDSISIVKKQATISMLLSDSYAVSIRRAVT